MRTWLRRWSISTRLFALMLVFVLGLMAVVLAWVWADVNASVEQNAAAKSMTVATSVAVNPFVVDALESADPSAQLQPYAVKVMAQTSTDFVTIMALDRTRYTHPNPAEIGKPFIGTIAPALRGRSFTETYTGTLGPSVRAVVPIKNSSGTIVALVSAGITVANVTDEFAARLPIIFLAAAGTILVGAAASWLLSRYLRRVTLGLGPEEMSRIFAYHEGVLHSVKDALVLVDAHQYLVLYNDQAAQLLGLPAQSSGHGAPVPLSTLTIPVGLDRVFAGERLAVDEAYVVGDRIVIVSSDAVRAAGRGRANRVAGTVVSLRDHTELQRLSGELETMRTLSDALRSQTHEYSNRMHTIASLIELDRSREALQFATSEVHVSQQLADELVGAIREPVLAALLLGKEAQASERGIQFTWEADISKAAPERAATDLVTIVGNLIDNAMDASRTSTAPPHVDVQLMQDDSGGLRVRVADNGRGVTDAELAFQRGYSTKDAGAIGRGIGLALVRQSVRRLGGTIELANDDGAVFTVHLPGAPVEAQTADSAWPGGAR
ncbi:MAG TPA: sensor histidine kinase [Microbacteriaceae bacterium]